MVLMHLRLNIDISYRFEISNPTITPVDRNIVFTLKISSNVAFMRLQHNIPQIFKEAYPNTRCIIVMERPYSFEARAQIYSNYKKHNTVSFNRYITAFLSKCWGGRVTDSLKCHNVNSY